MPRPKKPGAPEPKRRSRNGCWPCKGRKVKCGEEHPTCINCQKTGEVCDYSVRLNWEGRRTKRSDSFGTPKQGDEPPQQITTTPIQQSSFTHTFSINGPPAQILPNPTVRLIQKAPGTIEPAKGKQERSDTQASYNIGTGAGSFCATPPQEQVSAPSPTIPKHVIDSFYSTPPVRQKSSRIASPASQRPHKRSKSFAETSDFEAYREPTLLASPASLNSASPPMYRIRSNTYSTPQLSPLIPVSSGANPEDEPRTPLLALPSPASPGNSRISVKCLLSGSPDLPNRPKQEAQHKFGPLLTDSSREAKASDDAIFYGYDLGRQDADINENDDASAISRNPLTSLDALGVLNDKFPNDSPFQRSIANVKHSAIPGMGGGYYERPISIWIPRSVEPLPSKLRENPMNLLYFHHFINHTAKILVPYDDPKSNPFRTILPQMATRNDNLLSLLLAYSASHRARLLRQREPEMRIALWVQDIFPALRRALGDREQIISNSSLATAIILASLEIISPTAFGYEIPWQTHLNLARDLMQRRLADLRRTPFGSHEERVFSFLWSWFAYLDVLGSLSGGAPINVPPRPWVLEYATLTEVGDQYEIDCIMGFTNRCVQLLAQVSELARYCDLRRIESNNQASSECTPSPDCVRRAQQLERELLESMAKPSHPCRHVQDVEARDKQEMLLMNEAFHLAGLVHLHRRVFGKPSGHVDVQGPVQRIASCMECIRPGGTAETGFLFPMFTAGCNTLDEGQRTRILMRFKGVEGNGMTQVHKARKMMERVWVTGQAWEPLLCTEFIG